MTFSIGSLERDPFAAQTSPKTPRSATHLSQGQTVLSPDNNYSPISRPQSPRAMAGQLRSSSPLSISRNASNYPHIRISEPELSQPSVSTMADLISSSKAHMKPKIVEKMNLKYHNQALISYLAGQGLNMNPLMLQSRRLKDSGSITQHTSNFDSNSQPINTSSASLSNIETYITGNGQILFLPFDADKKKRRRRARNIRDEYNDDDDDHNDVPDGEEYDDGIGENESDYFGSPVNDSLSSSSLNLSGRTQASSSPHISISDINLGSGRSKKLKDNATYHTFGVIVKIKKTTNLNSKVKASYHAHANVKYDSADNCARSSFEDRYRISKMIDWDLDLSIPDCYIPFNKIQGPDQDDLDLANDTLDSDSIDISSKTVNDMFYADTPTQKIKCFTPLKSKDYVSESLALKDESLVERNLFENSNDTNLGKSFEPGYYVFLLPVMYPINTPESIMAPNGRLSHAISIQIQKGSVTIPTLQAPQSAFLSTSPTMHFRRDDNSTDFNSVPLNEHPIQSPKNSFLKKIGLRRNSSSSSKSEISSRFNPTSPKSIFDLPKSRSRAGSNAQMPLSMPLSNRFATQPAIQNFSHELPAIRLPPSDATSTLNKSIYVNKIWNNSLNYELLLPKKFTQLSPPSSLNIGSKNKFLKNNTFMLQMKLVPLVKELQLKRIKINIVEKISYFEKNNNEGDKSYRPRGKTKERVVTMMEIKTKDKAQSNQHGSTSPLKTQIIKGCENDNLLTFCYDVNHPAPTNTNSGTSMSRSNSNGFTLKHASSSLLHSAKKMSRVLDHSNSETINQQKKEVTITNPVKLQCPLNFTANDDSHYITNVYENLTKGASYLTDLQDESTVEKANDTLSIFSVNSNTDLDDFSELNSNDLRSRAFSFSSADNTASAFWESVDDKEKQKTHSFIPDTSFSNLKVRHRLQMAFRISKRDEKTKGQEGEAKMHHYEVIVDTPIIFVSPFCVDETLELPSYEDAVKTSVFETDTDVDSPSFSISKTDSSMLSDENNSFSSDEPFATLVPCSPLMKDGGSFLSEIPSASLNSSEQMTSLLSSSPPFSDDGESFIDAKRRNSSTLNSSVPLNATSLLSAAFTRSKERSNSLHSALANDMSSLSLASSTSRINTIDSLMCETHAPPGYTEVGSTSKLSTLMKSNNNELPPSYDNSLKAGEKQKKYKKLALTSLKPNESRINSNSETSGNHKEPNYELDEMTQKDKQGIVDTDNLNAIDSIIKSTSTVNLTSNVTPSKH